MRPDARKSGAGLVRLINATDNDCLVASLAMVLDLDIEDVKSDVIPDPLEYPFPPPWNDLPLVPDMNVVADWLFTTKGSAITPFEHAPYCTPDINCPTVSVYNEDAGRVFEQQLSYGPGMIECWFNGNGHMVAWDGERIYDPHGYIYNLSDTECYGTTPHRFWLFSKVTG